MMGRDNQKIDGETRVNLECSFIIPFEITEEELKDKVLAMLITKGFDCIRFKEKLD